MCICVCVFSFSFFVALHAAATTVGCNHTACHVGFSTVQTRTGLMSPYIWEYYMWHLANCLKGRPCVCVCVCLRVVLFACVHVCLHFCMHAPLSLRHWGEQTEPWPCRNIELYWTQPVLHQGHTQKSRIYTKKKGVGWRSVCKNVQSTSVSFFLSLLRLFYPCSHSVLLWSNE